jgi:HPt (histidine-containing phosphotransfer) domain-containing protein
VAVGNRDVKTAQQGAHGLKGSSSAMGALKIAKLCEEIERRSEAGDVDACSPLATALIEEFYRVNKSLAHELGVLTANTNS